MRPLSEVPLAQRRRDGRQPLIWAALAYAAGIVTGVHCWRPPLWWVLAGLAFLIITGLLVRRRPRVAGIAALSALFCIGALSIGLRPPRDPGRAILAFADGQEISVTAHVMKDGTVRPGGFGGARQTLDLETEEVSAGDRESPIRAGLRMSLYSKEPQPVTDSAENCLGTLHYGQRIRFLGKLHAPRNFRNPGAFDYESYLAENGIAALGSGKAEEVELLPGFAGNQMAVIRAGLRRSVMRKIQQLWSPPHAALLDAMIIGEDAFIGRDTRLEFQRSGTYHILVVSGMNVGILAMVTFWLLRRFRASEIVASAITVLLSVAYAFLTDVGPPIWRATLMLALYLGARLLYRERSMLNAVGAAALGLLMVDPRALLGASFQLTFLSVLIIAGLGVPVLERTTQPLRRGLRYLDSTHYDAALPPRAAQFRLDLRIISARLERFLGKGIPLPILAVVIRSALSGCEILIISALMQIGLALPMAYYFHRATVLGLPANVLVVPLTGVLMPAAVLAVAVGYLWLPLAKLPAAVAALALNLISGTVRSLGQLRLGELRVATPEIAVLLLGAAGLGLAILLARSRPWLASTGMAIMIATAALVVLIPPQLHVRSAVMEVTAIDVGQGDSTLIISPQGRTVLIDAGGPVGGQQSDFDIGEEVVSPYLWSRGISRLDAVMITHGHSDHIGGMPAIVRNFRPRELWIGVIPPSPPLARLLDEARELGTEVVEHGAPDEFDFGGASVRVLAPPHGAEPGRQPRNNDSLVASFAFQDSAVLVEGDAEKQVERSIALTEPRAGLLKLAHNGSNTSTTPELLRAVQPRFAFISVGARNSFGHPRPQVLARLAAAGVAAYRTDLDGTITFYLDGKTISPQLGLH